MSRKQATAILSQVMLIHFCIQGTISLAQSRMELKPYSVAWADSAFVKRIAAIDPGTGGEHALWKFQINDIDNRDIPIFFLALSDTTVLCIGENSMTTYQVKGDTLSIVAEETPYLQMTYDRPILQLAYPFTYKDSVYSCYEGHGRYCGNYTIHTAGEMRVKADGFGEIIFGDGLIVSDVLRVYTLQTSSSAMDIDSTKIDDAVRKQEIVERYQWFAKDCSIPILEVVSRTSYNDGTMISSTRDAWLLLQNDRWYYENEARPSAGQPEQEANPLIRYNVSVNDSEICIDYSVTENVTVKTLVCNTMGMLLKSVTQSSAPDSECRLRIDCVGMKKGAYVLYLNVNGKVYSNKVTLN